METRHALRRRPHPGRAPTHGFARAMEELEHIAAVNTRMLTIEGHPRWLVSQNVLATANQVDGLKTAGMLEHISAARTRMRTDANTD